MEGTTLPPPPHWKRDLSESAALSQRRKGDDITPLAPQVPHESPDANGHNPPKSADYIYHNRRESAEQPHRNSADDYHRPLSATRATMPSLTSPSNAGGSFAGPPPPYSYHASNASAERNGYGSPSNASGSQEEKAPPRQSLPSLLEALNKEPYPPYGAQTSSIPPPPPSHSAQTTLPPPTTTSNYQTSTNPSPTHRSHAESSYSSHHAPLPPYSHESTESKHLPPTRQSSQYEDRGPPSYPTSAASPEHGQSPRVLHPPAHTSPTYPPSSQSYPSTTQSAASYPPTSYPPSSQSQTPTSSHPSSTYPPSTQGPGMAPIPPPAYRNYQPAYSYPPPPMNTFAAVNAPQWRPEHPDPVDDARKAAAVQQKHSASHPPPPPQQHYGEAVKRHLDIFDLESSLNEMAEGCGRGLDFARHFGNRAHAHPRAGPPLAALPRLSECDDMIQRHERVLSALGRIRDFVVAQQHAAAEQEQQQAAQAQHRDAPPPEPRGEDSSERDKREGGFAGGDAKKRRGRNAPPGRCHSCNRAETPEWRRGPDGARTLCNACGLHYAKLTRKHGAKAGLTSSSLRPKENGEM